MTASAASCSCSPEVLPALDWLTPPCIWTGNTGDLLFIEFSSGCMYKLSTSRLFKIERNWKVLEWNERDWTETNDWSDFYEPFGPDEGQEYDDKIVSSHSKLPPVFAGLIIQNPNKYRDKLSLEHQTMWMWLNHRARGQATVAMPRVYIVLTNSLVIIPFYNIFYLGSFEQGDRTRQYVLAKTVVH